MVMGRPGKLCARAPRIAASPASAVNAARRVSMATVYRWRRRMPLLVQQRRLEGAGDGLFALAGYRRVADHGDDLARVRQSPEAIGGPASSPVIEPVAHLRLRHDSRNPGPSAGPEIEQCHRP